MWGTKTAKAALWLSCCVVLSSVAAEAGNISAVDFCDQYASSCLGGQTPSLPYLVIKDPQGQPVANPEQSAELSSDDPAQTLQALQTILTTKPDHSALLFLPVDKACLPCGIWHQAVSDWLQDNAELSVKLIEVDPSV
jgi:hypothetical protein